MFPHKVGDLVTRRSDVFNDKSALLTGIVAKGPYNRMSPRFGWYPELYDVLWQQLPKISRGYMRHGLQARES